MRCTKLTSDTVFRADISDTDAAVLLGENGTNWQPRGGYTPIYQLQFQNGVTEGIGYMEGWVGAPEPISGTNAVRETFTVSGAEVKVSSVAIRVARVNGNGSSDRAPGKRRRIADRRRQHSGCRDSAEQCESPAYYWASYTLSSNVYARTGSTYHLDFEASSTSTYQAFPIRKGSLTDFSPPLISRTDTRNSNRRTVGWMDPVGRCQSHGWRSAILFLRYAVAIAAARIARFVREMWSRIARFPSNSIERRISSCVSKPRMLRLTEDSGARSTSERQP